MRGATIPSINATGQPNKECKASVLILNFLLLFFVDFLLKYFVKKIKKVQNFKIFMNFKTIPDFFKNYEFLKCS